MANKKISQLTPKGSALAGTDLLEVSVFNGVTYDTKSLTGANVVSGLQPTLVSGTSIKTINSTTLLGSGDVAVQPTLVSATNIKTINSISLLGSGDIVIGGGGLTVGTTAIASGTVGRVLFEGTGNVVQQDAGFLFDTTAKTLTNYGKGGINTNTSFGVSAGQSNTTGVQNSFFGFEALKNNLTGGFNTAMGYTSLRDTTGIGYNTAIGWGAGIGVSSGHTNTLLGYGAGGGITTGNSNTIIGVNIATLASSTTNNVILADGGGNIALRKDVNHFVGIGYSATATLGAKLDVKAQGALSTDIAFRVRNSADSANLVTIQGDGSSAFGTYTNPNTRLTVTGTTFGAYISGNTGIYAQSNTTSGTIYAIDCLGRALNGANTSHGIRATSDTGGVGSTNFAGRFNASNGTTNYAGYFDSTGGTTNYALYIQRGDMHFGVSPTLNKIGFWNATPIVQPTTAVAAATVVNGTGGTVKHDDTFDGYTLQQVVKALRNAGLLA